MNKPGHEELVALYRRLEPIGALPDSLASRRGENDAERARRREQAAAERARIAEERRRRDTEFASARERREQAEAAARERLDAPQVPPIRALAPELEPEKKPDWRVAKRAELQARRAEVAAGLIGLEHELIGLRDRLRALEQRVQEGRVKLRAIDVSIEEIA